MCLLDASSKHPFREPTSVRLTDRLQRYRLIETNLHSLNAEPVTARGTLLLAELHVAEFGDGTTLVLLCCRGVRVLRNHLLTHTSSALETSFHERKPVASSLCSVIQVLINRSNSSLKLLATDTNRCFTKISYFCIQTLCVIF